MYKFIRIRIMSSMCNITTLTLLIFVLTSLFFLSGSLYAQTQWVKYEGNPIFTKSPPVRFDDNNIQGNFVLFDGSLYKMWYNGQSRSMGRDHRIGLAISTDGLTWEKIDGPGPGYCVLDRGDSWDKLVYLPCVIIDKEENIYKMWYTGHDYWVDEIGYATSPDGINWTKYSGNPVFKRNLIPEFSRGVCCPHVIKDNTAPSYERYKMWFVGYNEGVAICKIGYSVSADGINWSIPKIVMYPYTDEIYLWKPCVIKDGTNYHLWFEYYKLIEPHTEIGYAISQDGINWIRYVNNPVLKRGDVGEWDYMETGTPSVIKMSNIYKMWYKSNMSIGYATSMDKIIISIDIKPGSDNNPINLNSKGVIPVAIITTSKNKGETIDFDASTVDPLSVEFGPKLSKECHNKGHIEDVDNDGDLDMVLHFRTEDTGVPLDAIEANILGKTRDGQIFTGKDIITIIGSKLNKSVEEVSSSNDLTSDFILDRNYPNPFNPETVIKYSLPKQEVIKLEIYNISGKKIKTLENNIKNAGNYMIIWDGKNDRFEQMPSGIYLCKLSTPIFQKTICMMLIK